MKRITIVAALALAGLSGLVAQTKQPQPKSPKEVEALQAMFNAQDPDTRIKAGEDLLVKFADTEFKAVASYMIAASYDQKNDYEKMVIWAERALQADPKSFATMLMLAAAIPKHSQEHDLDLEEKLTKSDKYAKSALELVATAEKPNPQLTDDQWAAAKRDFASQAHESFALSAVLRKKYDIAITEFKQSLENAAAPDPATTIRLGRAYLSAGKPDEAIAVLDKLMASPDTPVQMKQIAQADRARAMQAKGPAPKN